MMMRAGVRMAAAGVVLLAVPCAFAGPITPPPGPVSGTHKTLTDVEPRVAINATNTPGDAAAMFRILQSGSYYLTGDLVVDANMAGIRIAAPSASVTIDLNGFTIRGQGGNSPAILTDLGVATARSVMVRNGRVLDMSGAANLVADAVVISDLSVDNSASNGLVIDSLATPAVLERCTLSRVTFTAIRTDRQAIPSRFPAVVRDCVVRLGSGQGIAVGPGSMVTGCIVEGGSEGIRVGDSSVVLRCAATATTGVGINAGSNCLVEDSLAASNALDGIVCGTQSRVQGCVSNDNGDDGISAGGASSVVSCTVILNVGDGILVGSDCFVSQNTADSNGAGAGDGAGIHSTSTDNRIEGNNCTDNDRGIDVDASGSIIVRNTCSGNSVNWDVATGNVCLVVSATTAPAILGNAGGTAPGSTDPSVNFTY